MLSRRRLAILAVLLIAFDALNIRQQNRKVAADGYGDDPNDEKLNFGEWIGSPIVRLLERVDRRWGSHLTIRRIAKRIYWLPYRGSQGGPYRWYRPTRFDKETDPPE
jgi:hypothetical protein